MRLSISYRCVWGLLVANQCRGLVFDHIYSSGTTSPPPIRWWWSCVDDLLDKNEKTFFSYKQSCAPVVFQPQKNMGCVPSFLEFNWSIMQGKTKKKSNVCPWQGRVAFCSIQTKLYKSYLVYKNYFAADTCGDIYKLWLAENILNFRTCHDVLQKQDSAKDHYSD